MTIETEIENADRELLAQMVVALLAPLKPNIVHMEVSCPGMIREAVATARAILKEIDGEQESR